MRIETPESVDNRVLHEQEMPPGTICRRVRISDDGEVSRSPWFMVLTEPYEASSGLSGAIKIVWLEDDEQGKIEKKFLADLGAVPPYRGVLEKHDLEVPSKLVAGTRLARSLNALAGRVA